MNVYIRLIVRKTLAINKFVMYILLCTILLALYANIFYPQTSGFKQSYFKNISLYTVRAHQEVINSFYNKRQTWRTSNLGSVLFKNVKVSSFQKKTNENRIFTVLIWKYWDWLQNRHVYNFKPSRVDNSLRGCSVRNCIFKNSDKFLDTADAVVIHLQHGEFPRAENRHPDQRWVFLTDESPLNTFSLSSREPNLQHLANMFNWSMTYRTDSDVPVPYGRTLPLPNKLFMKRASKPITDLIPYWKKKRGDVLVAILISNCRVSHRMKFLKELKEQIDVDVHGGCSENLQKSCPGHFRSDCPVISEYLFYLVLENSMCREYLTEKAFYHAYNKGAIPIIMGPPVAECNQILPPNSFLHVDNYANAKELAAEIISISNDVTKLLEFHEWRKHFKVVNDHGYFGSQSKHYCRICEALNYNDDSIKIYDTESIRSFLDPSNVCMNK